MADKSEKFNKINQDELIKSFQIHKLLDLSNLKIVKKNNYYYINNSSITLIKQYLKYMIKNNIKYNNFEYIETSKNIFELTPESYKNNNFEPITKENKIILVSFDF
jgi:hypothetical protein